MFILFLNRCIIMMITAFYLSHRFLLNHSCSKGWEDTFLPDICFCFLSPRTKESVRSSVVADLSFLFSSRLNLIHQETELTHWFIDYCLGARRGDANLSKCALKPQISMTSTGLLINWNHVILISLVCTEQSTTCPWPLLSRVWGEGDSRKPRTWWDLPLCPCVPCTCQR